MRREIVVRLDNGWIIKKHDGHLRHRYYLIHYHEGYEGYVESAFSGTVQRCRLCKVAVPKKAQGFIELLKWEL